MSSSRASVFQLEGRRIFVAGHRGMVGAAVVRQLEKVDCEILTIERNRLDLCRQRAVEDWFGAHKPDAVVLAAARVGGILANDGSPAEFLHDNLVIQSNVIHAAYLARVAKLVFLGSSCIYPKMATQPIREEELLNGPLEPTNQWYAIAKIAGLKMCQAYRRQYGCDFISAMPTNLYGPGDNYDLKTSHVVPALIAKAHAAKENGAATLKVWGTGKARREFLHVDDAADALVHLLRHYSGASHINVGAGTDISIVDLAELICEVVGFRGELVFDTDLPDGTPRKLLDCSRLSALGWHASMALREGVADACRSYRRDVIETAVIPEPAARRPAVKIGSTTTEPVSPGYRRQPIGAK